jgi:hypothetical protein
MDLKRVIKGPGLAVLLFLVSTLPPAAAGQVDPYQVTLQGMYEMYDRDARLVMMAHFKEIVLDSGLPDSLFTKFKRK